MLINRPRGIRKERVFLHNGKSIEKRIETALKSTGERAGIVWGKEEDKGFIFNDLRRTFDAEMRRAGLQIATY
jgi:hypothetical protein